MKRIFRVTTMAFLACLSAIAFAKGEPVFERLDNGKRVTLQDFTDHPVLLIFWRSDCAPCVAEMPVVAQIAAAHPELPIALISLQDRATTLKYFTSPPPRNITLLVAQGDAREVLESMGDARAALPFSVALHAGASTCVTHYGLLGTDMVNDWVKRC